MMAAIKLSAIAAAVNEHGAAISDAVSNEIRVRDKWLTLGKTLYADGVRVAMLVPSTDKNPNDKADQSLIETITRYVVVGLSASKKGLKFDTPNPYAAGKTQTAKGPHMWTIADMLSLTRDELRAIDDETLKAARRYWTMQVGSMFGKVRNYVDRQENPDKHRAEKEEKAKEEKAKTEAPNIPRTIAGFMFALNDMNANINNIGLSARDAENVRESLLDAYAKLKSAKDAKERAAK